MCLFTKNMKPNMSNDGNICIPNDVTRCIAFLSKGTIRKVYPHWIYRLIIDATTQTKSYHLGKTQLGACVMEKMSKAIQNDEMIGQAFEPKQTQTTYVMRIKIHVKNDVGKKMFKQCL